MSTEHTQEQDYYTTLGIPATASPSQIQVAFRQLALEHHPDKGGDPASFLRVREAYETLIDPDRRRLYDSGEPSSGQTALSSADFENIVRDFDASRDRAKIKKQFEAIKTAVREARAEKARASSSTSRNGTVV